LLDQLDEERRRKTSLEQRGTAVITTSGTLVSLLFALAALITTRKQFHIPPSAQLILLLAVAFFVIAATGRLLANVPLRYANADHRDLARFLKGDLWVDRLWGMPFPPAERRAADLQLVNKRVLVIRVRRGR